MIKFFRHIRKNMVKENKVSKYMLYAIGEIVLVVIGILIALQINNWNEQRKLRSVEHEILQDINNNLKQSKLEIESDIKSLQQNIKHHKQILHYIHKDLPYHTDLDSAFSRINGWPSPHLTFTAYETLKTKGLDIIQNDSIKNAITNMYESNFSYLINDYDKSEWTRAQSVTYPFFDKHIRMLLLGSDTARPNNFEDLKNNAEFINILHGNIASRNWGISSYQEINIEIEILIKMIDKELNK